MNRKKLRMVFVLIALVLTGAVFTSAFLSTMNGNQVQENILLDLSMGLAADDYVVHDPVVIMSDADFVSQGWEGSGTPEDPYLIDGLKIEGGSYESCIEIEDTRTHFVVSNCFLYGTYGYYWTAGVYLANATNGLIEQNTFTQNEDAIHLDRSENNTIRGNELYDNHDGIYLSDSDNNVLTDNDISDNSATGIEVYQSDGVNILNNTSNRNYEGIDVKGGMDSYSHDIIIANNTCEGNTGIVMGGRGIYLRSVSDVVVANNTCSDNYYGLYASSSISITVTENVFAENSYQGISLAMSTDISVTWNALIDNYCNGYEMTLSAPNLFDYNYWSDYTGVDEDEDGIGDTPYQDVIGGEPPYEIYGNIVDNHPLMYWPWFEPTTTTDETIDGDDQPISPVIVGALIGAVCIIIVIVLAQSRRK